MDLAMSEMRVQNEVPVPDSTSKNLDKLKSTMRNTRRLMWLFKLCCNVFCELVEWFISFAKLYTNVRAARICGVGCNRGVAIKSPYNYLQAFPMVSSSYHCVVSFMNASILLELWFNSLLLESRTQLSFILVRC